MSVAGPMILELHPAIYVALYAEQKTILEAMDRLDAETADEPQGSMQP